MKKKLRRFGIILAAVLVCVQCSTVSFAYFQRGDVNVKAGKQNVTLDQGSSENVSVSFDPSSSSQLPGCGMAECPQSCGEKECLDENGECTCNGTTYQTYYAYATASSSNTSVATAKYDNGVVTIKGVAPGTATITLTASLRQFTSTSTTINVTVNKASGSGGSSGSTSGSQGSGSSSSSGNSGSSSSGSSSASGSSSGQSSSGQSSTASGSSGVTAKSVSENTGSSENTQNENVDGQAADGENAESGEVSEDEISVIESDRGKIIFVPITEGTQGKAQFEEIMDQEAYVDFQMKDDAGTVLYAWEFFGKDVKIAQDMDFSIESSTNPFDGCSYGTSADSLYLSFAHEDEFPGKASIYFKVNDIFSDDQSLNLYLYNETKDAVSLVQEGIQSENGYVTMELERGGKFILTSQTLESKAADEAEEKAVLSNEDPSQKSHVGVIVAVIIIIAAAAVCAGVVFMKKRKKGDTE